jgi:hypothetical protein
MVEKLTSATKISPIDTGEAFPLGVQNLFANSKQPFGLNRDLAKFTPTPISEHMARYSSTTLLFAEAESSPRTAYGVYH